MSKTFGGRATDGQIVNQAKFPRVLEPEDKVLSDKGLPKFVPDIVNTGAIVVMPPRKSKNTQFSEEDNKYGYEVASVRVHVCIMYYFLDSLICA